MTVRRFDSGSLAPPVRTPEGWLRVHGRISRVGVQVYVNADGSQRREFRPPEEVFSKESLDSLALIPLTVDHPAGLLDAGTARIHARGSVGRPERDGESEWVRAEILVTDADAVEWVDRFDKRQLSVGYTCELDMTPGTYQGQEYDCVQRSIRGNHLALVDRARAGAGASLRLDGSDAAALGSDLANDSDGAHEESRMALVKIDGIELAVTEANAAAIQQAADKQAAALVAARAETDKVRAEAKSRADEAAKAVADAKAKADAEAAALEDAKKMAECDECMGEGEDPDGEECDSCGGSGKMFAKDKKADASQKEAFERYRLRQNSREALDAAAKKHCGEGAKLDGLKTSGVKRLILAKLRPELKLDGMSAGQVAGRLAEVLDGLAKTAGQPSPTDLAREAALAAAKKRGDAAPAPSNPTEARAAYAARMQSAWKPKK